jgi:hypothetical protein
VERRGLLWRHIASLKSREPTPQESHRNMAEEKWRPRTRLPGSGGEAPSGRPQCGVSGRQLPTGSALRRGRLPLQEPPGCPSTRGVDAKGGNSAVPWQVPIGSDRVVEGQVACRPDGPSWPTAGCLWGRIASSGAVRPADRGRPRPGGEPGRRPVGGELDRWDVEALNDELYGNRRRRARGKVMEAIRERSADPHIGKGATGSRVVTHRVG